jgi:hypothetical protein
MCKANTKEVVLNHLFFFETFLRYRASGATVPPTLSHVFPAP